MSRRRRAKLTEADWRAVFRLRCRAKAGEQLSGEDMRLIEAAHLEDGERYGAMEADVFDATVPFGSNVKWPRF